jgi:hypothetical protein
MYVIPATQLSATEPTTLDALKCTHSAVGIFSSRLMQERTKRPRQTGRKNMRMKRSAPIFTTEAREAIGTDSSMIVDLCSTSESIRFRRSKIEKRNININASTSK